VTAQIFGLKIIDRERPFCCTTNVCVIGSGKGPHVGELRCADCGRHRGWLPKEAFCWFESVVAIYGPPVKPIEMAQDYGAIAQGLVVDEQERRRRIFEIRRRIELGGFELKDFLLTSPPDRDFWRERQRRRIAHLMGIYELSVLDIHADVGAVGGMQASAPKRETEMDCRSLPAPTFCGLQI
jgi:hypothetical protein